MKVKRQRVDMRLPVPLLEKLDERIKAERARGNDWANRTAIVCGALANFLDYTPRELQKLREKGERLSEEKYPESRTSPAELSEPLGIAERLQRRITAKMAQGRTSKLAEIEAREELGL